jgi:hypothetical protein
MKTQDFGTKIITTTPKNLRNCESWVSKKRLALQLGGTALVAKLADDLSEEALAPARGARAGTDWQRALLSFCCRRAAK